MRFFPANQAVVTSFC